MAAQAFLLIASFLVVLFVWQGHWARGWHGSSITFPCPAREALKKDLARTGYRRSGDELA